MATEKILIFDEQGNAKRMKVRIARFLDNEPVTASDKTNIRTTLDVDDSLSGTFTTPLSVTSASDSSFTGGGKVGIGTSSPDAILETSQSVAGSADGALLTNTNQSGSSDSVSLSFGLGRTVDNYVFDVPAIKLQKEQQWTGTGSTVDGKLVFSTIQNETVSERAVIDSGGRVGIGTSSPGSLIHVKDNGDSSNDGGIQIERSTGSTTAFFNMRGGRVGFGSMSSVPIKFYVNGQNKWSIGTNGHLTASASGVGIDFGSGATLDEYEEGTHTTAMTLTSSGSITLGTSNDRLGYCIIGDQVFITGKLVIDSATSPVGNPIITLPTVPKNMTESGGSGGLGVSFYDYGTNTWSAVPIVWDEGSSNVYIRMDGSGLEQFDQFRFSFTYQTA